MQVVVEMAANGPEAFDRRISSLIDEWRLQLLNADFTPTLTSLHTDMDFDEIYAQNRRTSPALEARIEPIPDTAPSTQVLSTQGASAPRGRKRMVLEPNVIMNRAFTRSMSRALAETNKEQITVIIHTAFENAAKEAEASQQVEEGDEMPAAAPKHVDSSSTQPVTNAMAAEEGASSDAASLPSQDGQQPARTVSASPTLPVPNVNALPSEKGAQTSSDGTPARKALSLSESLRAPHGIPLSSSHTPAMSSQMPGTGRQSIPPSPFLFIGCTPMSTPLLQRGLLQDEREPSINFPPSPLVPARETSQSVLEQSAPPSPLTCFGRSPMGTPRDYATTLQDKCTPKGASPPSPVALTCKRHSSSPSSSSWSPSKDEEEEDRSEVGKDTDEEDEESSSNKDNNGDEDDEGKDDEGDDDEEMEVADREGSTQLGQRRDGLEEKRPVEEQYGEEQGEEGQSDREKESTLKEMSGASGTRAVIGRKRSRSPVQSSSDTSPRPPRFRRRHGHDILDDNMLGLDLFSDTTTEVEGDDTMSTDAERGFTPVDGVDWAMNDDESFRREGSATADGKEDKIMNDDSDA